MSHILLGDTLTGSSTSLEVLRNRFSKVTWLRILERMLMLMLTSRTDTWRGSSTCMPSRCKKFKLYLSGLTWILVVSCFSQKTFFCYSVSNCYAYPSLFHLHVIVLSPFVIKLPVFPWFLLVLSVLLWIYLPVRPSGCDYSVSMLHKSSV